MTNIWLAFGKYLAIHDWNFYMLQVLYIKVRITIIYNCIFIVLSIKSLEKIWNYIKRDLYLFLFLQITQINWMYGKILLNVHVIKFILLSEYLYIAETDLNIFVTIKYCTILGEKMFLLVLASFCAFGAVLLFHSGIILFVISWKLKKLELYNLISYSGFQNTS